MLKSAVGMADGSRHGRWLNCAGFGISHQPFCHQAGFFGGRLKPW
jgi:hypothetical protein